MASFDPRTDIPVVTRAGWECPRCLTVYNPDVEACHCTTRKPLSERLKQDRQPIQLGGGLIRFPEVRC